jgi:LmbE family N-acetylglucosaminyl deacetylase
MLQLTTKTVAIIIAHPDDEILWVGGTILSNQMWKCFIVCLCRKSDEDRAPKFYKSLEELNAEGNMGDLDDGPAQMPLDNKIIEHAILKLMPSRHFDLIISHDPSGEYTRHIRHEEIGEAVIMLWNAGKISTNELWTFAYEDGKKAYYPRAVEKDTFYHELSEAVFSKKYSLITQNYGFNKNSWEARATPHAEAFRSFTDPIQAQDFLIKVDALV